MNEREKIQNLQKTATNREVSASKFQEVIEMKKVLAMVLALLMLLGGAVAEEQAIENAIALENGAAVEVDLDGDGVMESVTLTRVMLNEYDEEAVVTVKNASGEGEWHSGMLYGAQAWVTDIDSNGLKEIFVSGDEMSDDYITYCLNYVGAMLEPLLFADVNRGENTGEYYPRGYGMVTAINGSEITLMGSQDMLGTWMAERRFSLIDGMLEIVDDGYWVCSTDMDDPEIWEYRSLKPVQAIPVTFIVDGVETAGELQSGERIMPTHFDKVADLFFVTEDGREGYLTAEPDAEAGWGWQINGISEHELFEMVPYAD